MAEAEQSKSSQQGMLGRLFGDLSVAQLIAGALAAATSLLLSTKIGIAGSVIGVAVGSIVSAVAGNMYKRFLQVSADKLKEVAVDSVELILPGTKQRLSDMDGDASGNRCDDACGEHGDEVAEPGLDECGCSLPEDRLKCAEAGQTRIANLDEDELLLALSDCADAAVAKARDQWRHEQQLQRRLVAVSVLSALVAVGATALLVFALTSGQGLGEKAPIIAPIVQAERSVADSADSTNASAEDSQQQSSDDGSDGKDASEGQDTSAPGGSGVGGSDSPSGSDSGSGEAGDSDGASGSSDSAPGDGGGASGGSGASDGSEGLNGAGGSGAASSGMTSGSGSGSVSSESASSGLNAGGSAIHPVN